MQRRIDRGGPVVASPLDSLLGFYFLFSRGAVLFEALSLRDKTL